MSETIVTLEYPITQPDGTVITELKIRRAKARDVRKMTGNTEAEQGISLLATLTGLVPEDIDELDISDFQKASKVIEAMTKGK